ncbi:MAG: hypothetical protein GY832_31050 [Chloroflexi bacterium]|nr:hypothetical protein [Chloroflexota bacterium]
MRATGATTPDIAAELGVAQTTVANWLRADESRAITLSQEAQDTVKARNEESIGRFNVAEKLEMLADKAIALIDKAEKDGDSALDIARIAKIGAGIATGLGKLTGAETSPVEVKEHHEFNSEEYTQLSAESD